MGILLRGALWIVGIHAVGKAAENVGDGAAGTAQLVKYATYAGVAYMAYGMAKSGGLIK